MGSIKHDSHVRGAPHDPNADSYDIAFAPAGSDDFSRHSSMRPQSASLPSDAAGSFRGINAS